ncbi:MAG: hypothetical protein J6X65_02305 [Bacteroidales bacterium]|nr:hypothetical protein [Bacteroidales bacterium]
MYVVKSFIFAFGIIVLSIGCSNSTDCSDENSSQSQSYSSSDESNVKPQSSTLKNSETEELTNTSSPTSQKEEVEKYTFTDDRGVKFILTLNPDKTVITKCGDNLYYGHWYDYHDFNDSRAISVTGDEPPIAFPNRASLGGLALILTNDNFLYVDCFAAESKNPKARLKVEKAR